MSDSNSDSSIQMMGYFAKRSIHSFNSDPSSSSLNPHLQAAKGQWHAIMSLDNISDEEHVRKFYTFQQSQQFHSMDPRMSEPVVQPRSDALYDDGKLLITKEILLHHLSTKTHSHSYLSTINGIFKAMQLIDQPQQNHVQILHALASSSFQLAPAQPNLRKDHLFNLNQTLMMSKQGRRMGQWMVRKIRLDSAFIVQYPKKKKIPVSFESVKIERKDQSERQLRDPPWISGREFEIFSCRVLLHSGGRAYGIYIETQQQSVQLRDYILIHNNTINFKKRAMDACAAQFNLRFRYSMALLLMARLEACRPAKPPKPQIMSLLMPPYQHSRLLSVSETPGSRDSPLLPITLEIPRSSSRHRTLSIDTALIEPRTDLVKPNETLMAPQPLALRHPSVLLDQEPPQRLIPQKPLMSLQQTQLKLTSQPLASPQPQVLTQPLPEKSEKFQRLAKSYLEFLYSSRKGLERFMASRLESIRLKEMMLKLQNADVSAITLKGVMEGHESKFSVDEDVDEDFEEVASIHSTKPILDSIELTQPHRLNEQLQLTDQPSYQSETELRYFVDQQNTKQPHTQQHLQVLQNTQPSQQYNTPPSNKSHVINPLQHLNQPSITQTSNDQLHRYDQSMGSIHPLHHNSQSAVNSSIQDILARLKPSTLDLRSKVAASQPCRRDYMHVRWRGNQCLKLVLFDTSIQETIGNFTIGQDPESTQSVQVRFSTREYKSLTVVHQRKQLFRQDFSSFTLHQLYVLIV